MFHADNETHGLFEFPDFDNPVKDSSNKVITTSFNISDTLSSSVAVENQEIVNEKVITNQAISAGLGWIIVYSDNEGSPGTILGCTQLFYGVNTNIEVSLTSTDRTSTIYAMLHTDEDDRGVFGFPGSDLPVNDASGNVITPSFIITNFTPSTSITSTTTVPTPGFTILYVLTLLGLILLFFKKRRK
ncbi:MAG: hypothetical protein ACFFAU_01825 [Candidatus Hodarchaeota archaeon]